jgi:translation initiation factor IF-2
MIRISDLARDMGVASRSVLDMLHLVGVTGKKTQSSRIEDEEAEKIRAYYVAHPKKFYVLPWIPHRSDSTPSSIAHSHVPEPGDSLTGMQGDMKPAEMADKRSQSAP